MSHYIAIKLWFINKTYSSLDHKKKLFCMYLNHANCCLILISCKNVGFKRNHIITAPYFCIIFEIKCSVTVFIGG